MSVRKLWQKSGDAVPDKIPDPTLEAGEGAHHKEEEFRRFPLQTLCPLHSVPTFPAGTCVVLAGLPGSLC